MNAKDARKGLNIMQITYSRNRDYLIPDLTAEPPIPLGKYGRMRRNYLKAHRPILWNKMILQGKLNEHLREIDSSASQRVEMMMSEMSAKAGATEKLKAEKPMEWTAIMNSLKSQAEEIILKEMIYA